MKQWICSAGMALCVGLALIGCTRETPGVFQGYVEGEFVHVATSGAGRLDTLNVARGDSVAAGDALFTLESENEAAALRQARKQLAAAEALLDDLKLGKRPQELDVIRSQVAQAKADSERAETERVRDEEQFVAGGISQSQLDRTRASAEISAARVRELEGQQAVAELPAREDQIRAQSAQVAAARAACEQAEWRLNQKSVASTVAGRVFDTLYRKGEWIPAGRPVVRLLPPENVKVRFFVPETELGRLAIGQDVALRCDGADAEIMAKVTYVSGEAEYTPPIIYSNERRSKLVFMVEARPVEPTANLHPGQPVQASLR